MYIWRVTKYVDGYIDSYDNHIPSQTVNLGLFTNMSYAVRAVFKALDRMSHKKKNTLFAVKDIHFYDDKPSPSVIIHLKKLRDETEEFLKFGRYDCLDKYGRAVLELNCGDYFIITKVPVDKDTW